MNLFFKEPLWAQRAQSIEEYRGEKRDVKKIFAMARIVSWELETPQSFQKFISERRANRSKFV